MIIVARCIQAEEENDWGSILLARQEEDGTFMRPRIQETVLTESKDVRKQFQENYHSVLTSSYGKRDVAEYSCQGCSCRNLTLSGSLAPVAAYW